MDDENTLVVYEEFMRRALVQAANADRLNEVPVGAVLVYGGKIIAEAFNQPIALSDPCAHAEIQALRKAGEILGNYRLIDTTLYVTIEPCLMCVGAILHARVGHVVYGAAETKMGAVHSTFQLLQDERQFHLTRVTKGVLELECKEQIQEFFKRRRLEKSQLRTND